MAIDLDVADMAQVSGHSVIASDLAVQDRSIHVISGIACPERKSRDENVRRERIRLRLRHASEGLEQWSVAVGLASIGNDDTNFAFGTDQAVLEIEDGELFLSVDVALAGDSTLSRFSYQVVLTLLQSTATITGTITWPTEWFRPLSSEPAALAGVFQIVLNRRSEIRLQGPFGGVREVLEPLSPGDVTGLTVGTETCQARYRILRPPLGTPLKVTVTTEALHGPGSIAVVPTVPDLDRVFVTLENPSEGGVDFYAKWYKEPA